jgi:hypothetical protein
MRTYQTLNLSNPKLIEITNASSAGINTRLWEKKKKKKKKVNHHHAVFNRRPVVRTDAATVGGEAKVSRDSTKSEFGDEI